jgi:hypothetical protein
VAVLRLAPETREKWADRAEIEAAGPILAVFSGFSKSWWVAFSVASILIIAYSAPTDICFFSF